MFEERLSGIFVLPVVKLWYALAGTTEGIVLFSRLSFVASQTAVAAFLYSRLRKYGVFSVPAVLIWYFNVPSWSMTLLYYNTVVVMMTGVVAALVLSIPKRRSGLHMFFIGFAGAVAILCSPFSASAYFAYTVAVAVCFIRAKKRPASFAAPVMLRPGSWLLVTLGAFFVAAAVVVYLFQGTSPEQVLAEYTFFNGDGSSGGAISVIFGSKDKLAPLFLAYLPLTVGVILPPSILTLAAAVDKKRVGHGEVYIIAGTVVCIVCDAVILFYKTYSEVNRALENILLLYAVFALYGLLCYLVTEKKERLVFTTLFCGGLFAAIMRCCESQSFVFAGAAVMSGCLAGAAVSAGKKAEEGFVRGSKSGKAIAVLIAAAMSVQLFSQVFLFLNMRFSVENHYGASISADRLDSRIGSGPLKGIYTTEAMAEYYSGIMSDIEVIKAETEGQVLTTNELTWIYLALGDRATAMYSEYLDNEWVDAESMRQYYERYPDTVPGCIYVTYRDVSSTRSGVILPSVRVAEPEQKDLFREIINNYPGRVTFGESGYIIDLR
ncbi:MAG: hypothetical protein IJM45_10470 [Clostridia bacterium]|nr:hypothetical protein [Clostridia bacterium]